MGQPPNVSDNSETKLAEDRDKPQDGPPIKRLMKHYRGRTAVRFAISGSCQRGLHQNCHSANCICECQQSQFSDTGSGDADADCTGDYGEGEAK